MRLQIGDMFQLEEWDEDEVGWKHALLSPSSWDGKGRLKEPETFELFKVAVYDRALWASEIDEEWTVAQGDVGLWFTFSSRKVER